MTTATKTRRIPLVDALTLAEDLRAELAPACVRIEIAGSVRRRMQIVGDIELVAVPWLQAPLIQEQLFGADVEVTVRNAFDERCAELREQGELADRLDVRGRPAWGAKFKRALYHDVPCDLFSVLAPAQWGVIYAIRTGPADFSHQFVTHHGVYFRDSKGARRGGLLPRQFSVRDGQLVDATSAGGCVLETPEEADFFAAIDVAYREPWARV
jgi:DNA polymerase/3'-5' exonuclease PolX